MGTANTVIYYLSGAGNSLRIARDLASRIGNTQLMPLAPVVVDGEIAPEADRVGVVFPVIMFGAPTIVSKFLKMVPLGESTYVFAVAANGGMMAGTLGHVSGLLRSRGHRLASGFSVVSHRIAKDPVEREEVLEAIAQTVKERAD